MMVEDSPASPLQSNDWASDAGSQSALGSSYITDFPFPFSPAVKDAVATRRADLDGTLFFDELLILAGLDHVIDRFPPESPEEFDGIVAEIEGCEDWEQLRRDCLVYYLLKYWGEDASGHGEESSSRAAMFRRNRLIPHGFATLADAYFYMDTGDLESAVLCLTDMRVQPDFIPKIMHALSISASPALVLKFVRLASPPMTERASLEIYVGALCDTNIVEALQYVRKFPESTDEMAQRPRLMGMILNSCLMPKPRPDALNILMSYPLTAYEQLVLNTYSLRPPPSLPESSLAVIQDLVIVRLIHQGRYSDAITLDKLFVAEAAKNGSGGGKGAVNKAAEARREMFAEIVSILPAIQRQLLDISLDEQTQAPKSAPSAPTGGAGAGAGDLTMSWEELQLGQSVASLTSSVRGVQTPLKSDRTPLSASIALRSATKPNEAMLRAFARSGAGDIAPAGPNNLSDSFGPGSGLEGSPAPGSISRPAPSSTSASAYLLSQSTSSMLGESVIGGPPASPFNVTSPFASRPRLSHTPIRSYIPQPAFTSTSSMNGSSKAAGGARRPPHPLQQSITSGAFFDGASSSRTSPLLSSQPGSPSPAPSSSAGRPSNTLANMRKRPSRLSESFTAGNNHVDLSTSDSWGSTSFFGPSKKPTPPTSRAPVVDESTTDADRVFKPSRALQRTPFVPSTYSRGGGASSSAAPPVPSFPPHLLAQSSFTPTKQPMKKKRGLDEMMMTQRDYEEVDQSSARDLWVGEGTKDEAIELVDSSEEDEENEPLPPRGNGFSQQQQRQSVLSQAEMDVEMDEEEAAEAERLTHDSRSPALDEEDDRGAEEEEDEEEEEAAAALLRVDSGSELPGAFPSEVSSVDAHEHETRARTSRKSFDERPAFSSFTSGSAEPEMREARSSMISRPSLRAKPSSSSAPAPAPKSSRASANPKPVSTSSATSSKPPSTRRATRATSVLSDADVGAEDLAAEEPVSTKPTKRTSSRAPSVRRSSRLSATPSAPSLSDVQQPKPKKHKSSRSSQSPPPSITGTSLPAPKRRSSRARSSSAGPPPSSRGSRKTAVGPKLPSLEE